MDAPFHWTMGDFDDLGNDQDFDDVIPPPQKPKRAYKKRVSIAPVSATTFQPAPAPAPAPATSATDETPDAESHVSATFAPPPPPPDPKVDRFLASLDSQTDLFAAPATTHTTSSTLGKRAFHESPLADGATPLKGADKLKLERQITQMKELFPVELKDFKMKKGDDLTPVYLQKCLDEMDAIVSTSSADSFLLDSVLQCFRVVEGASTLTNYDVTGLADALQANKQFHKLSKQLFVRYGCFNAVGPEYQMFFLVATTAWVCRTKNVQKKAVNEMLSVAPTPEQAAQAAEILAKRRRPNEPGSAASASGSAAAAAEPAAPAVNWLANCS